MPNLILPPLNASYAFNTFFVALHHSSIHCIAHAFVQVAIDQLAVAQFAVAHHQDKSTSLWQFQLLIGNVCRNLINFVSLLDGIRRSLTECHRIL